MNAATITVDLGAISANWLALRDRAAPARCLAMVKADAYGLGAIEVARALSRVGCDAFGVAHVSEGVTLREGLLPHGLTPDIMVMHGPMAGEEADVFRHDLLPVLNSPEQIERWAALARQVSRPLPCLVHIDTGMNRLGLGETSLEALSRRDELWVNLHLRYVMSHLARSEETGQQMNEQQRQAFDRLRRLLPPAPASLANSSAIFLGPGYHYDMVRPGVALYGVNPTPGRPNPMRETVRLTAKILQVRDVDTGMTVGYGATHKFTGPARIATVAVGYADGYLRSLSNRGIAAISEGSLTWRVPVVGRVSMDLITIDVSDVPVAVARPGTDVALIGGGIDLGELATLAQTNEYEIMTRFGARPRRIYAGGLPQ